MTNQEQPNTPPTQEAAKTMPETVEKPAPQFEGVVKEKLAKLSDFDLNNKKTTQSSLQKAEMAISANGGDPGLITGVTAKIHGKDTQEKEVITAGKQHIEEIKNSDPNTFSKKYHHPGYRLEVAKAITEERKAGGTGTEALKNFKAKTAEESSNFESQEKERSIAEIMKEKDLVVVHGIPFIQGGGGSNFNNKTINRDKLTFEDSYKTILGLEPTLSTSIPSPDRENNGLYYPAGVILGEGKILSARNEDSGSVSFGLYKRIPKYGEGEKHTAIQSNIDIEKTAKRGSETGYGAAWNELVVEKPKIAGMFYDLSFGEESFDPSDKMYEFAGDFESRKKEAEDRKKEFQKRTGREMGIMRQEAQKIGVPLYAFRNENGELRKYRVDTVPNPGYTDESLKAELVPKSKEILARNNNNFFSPEFQEFDREAKRKLRIMKGEEYTMTPVTAAEIYESKKEVPDDQKKKIIEELKEKGVFREQSEKEVVNKIKELEKERDSSD